MLFIAIFVPSFAFAINVKHFSNMTKSGNSMEQENNVTTDNSEWKLVKEPYFDKPSGKTLEIDVLKRKDNFSIINIGSGRELQEIFLVKGDFGEFKFMAWRVKEREFGDSEKYIEAGGYQYIITDTYIIYTNWSGMDKKAKELCFNYSKDIESALIHYPSTFPNSPAVKNVIFDIGTATKPHYVQAKDL